MERLVSLVTGGMQNCTSSCIRVLTKFSRRASSSDYVVTRSSGGSDVIVNEVKYSFKTSAIFAGSFMYSSLTLIAVGSLREGLAGTLCFSSFQRFFILSFFSRIFSLK